MKRAPALAGLVLGLAIPACAQVIQFESNGLKYQTLTKSGVTVIFTQLPAQIHEYAVLQISVSNGSGGAYTIRPEDFNYVRGDGTSVRAAASRVVVAALLRKASSHDFVKMMTTYEASVYGGHLQTTNGFEARRQAAMAVNSGKLRTAALASALSLVQTKLAQGESTDGAVFFATEGKPLGPGRLIVRTSTDVFEFLPTSE